MAPVDPTKLRLAQQCCKLFLTNMASVPIDVQLMAAELLAKTLITEVKPERRLQFLDMWIRSIRDEIVSGLKPKRAKANGK